MLSIALYLLTHAMLLSLHLSGGSFPRPLSAQEEKKYVERMLAGDIEARNVLVEHNLRLVAHIAKKYYTQSDEQDDLISIGTIGLIKGVSSYRPEKGTRLATYAAKCVENAILSQMRLWFQVNSLRAEKNRDGVFWHRYPRICISFALLWTAV